MTTYAQALEKARAHITQAEPRVKVPKLLEDDHDYLAVKELDGPWPMGTLFVLVSKATGELREEPPTPELIDKISEMA